jgi:hypothetical protein
MSNKSIEDLFQFIKSTANSVKLLEETDIPQARDIIADKSPIPDGCPSKASAVEFTLRGIAGRADELQQLLSELVQEVAKKEEQGEL